MRKSTVIMTIIACMAMISCSQSQSYNISVSFATPDFDGRRAYLTNYDTGDTLDSATVQGQRLTFSGETRDGFFARLIVDGKRFGMIVEPGDISVDWGENITATGTPLNEKYNALGEELDKIDSEMERVAQDFAAGQITAQESDRRNAQIEENMLATLHKGYEDNRDNALGKWAFTYYLIYRQFGTVQLDSILATAPASYRDLKRVKKAVSDAKALEQTAVGKTFTDFAVTGTDGNTERLSDLIGRDGNYTVVDFWASWCGPCRKEIKGALTSIHNKYNGKGVQIVGVAVWDKPEDTKAAVEAMAIPWHIMIGDHYMTEQTDLYGIAGIPHIMVVDPDGKILARGLEGQPLEQFIDNLMAQK